LSTVVKGIITKDKGERKCVVAKNAGGPQIVEIKPAHYAKRRKVVALAALMIKVYLAGPYTKGDVAENIHNVIKVADTLTDCGYVPYIPHLSHF
jgi:hypothetical protein